MAIEPEEIRRIKRQITEFLYATHGYLIRDVQIISLKRKESQIEIKGKYNEGSFLEAKIVNFTMMLDEYYRLVSYERT
jgi:hypothetical protein